MPTNDSVFFEQEEYKPVPDYPELFCSASGRVLSLRPGNGKPGATRRPHLLKPWMDKHGYLQFSRKGRWRKLFVHVAVLSSWVRPKRAEEVTRHLNGVRHDNRLCNLTWGTVRENEDDKVRHGSLKGESNPASKLSEADVTRLRSEYVHKSLSQLCRENPQWSKFGIWAAVSGYTWAHLPGAIPGGRRCSKTGWKSGIIIRSSG